MDNSEEPPSLWSTSKLCGWLGKHEKIDPEAIDSLAICDVDGRMFLEMDEEDLMESEELGINLKSIHAFLRLQEELEALELAYHGEQAPRPGATVLPPNPPSTGMGEGGRHSADLASGAATTAAAEYFPENSDSSCSSSWPLPCVSVDREGNSYFTDKIVKLSAGAASGIGALSELIPAMGLKFRETPGDYDFDFHTAPARQFVVSLDSAVDIEVSNGTRIIFPAGTVMLLEDTWGKGHRSRAVNGKSRRSLFLILPDDFQL